MILYYTNRQLSEKLEINLARWKRWSRSFLPPDPLGGMQSGYARQYAFKDLLKVFIGGHLLSHLKLSVPESRQVLDDLSPWMKKQGFFDWNGAKGGGADKTERAHPYRIYFCPLPPATTKNGYGFCYLIRHSVSFHAGGSAAGERPRKGWKRSSSSPRHPTGMPFLQIRMCALST
jgi:hypothetical protein